MSLCNTSYKIHYFKASKPRVLASTTVFKFPLPNGRGSGQPVKTKWKRYLSCKSLLQMTVNHIILYI